MKKLNVLAALMMLLVLAACKDNNNDPIVVNSKSFIGTWGVKQIDYYNIDFYGQPIQASLETYYFTPGDMNGGIDLIFRENRTGEMRDRSRDTLYLDYDTATQSYATIIPCPDTTLVTKYTYSFNAEDNLLFLNMQVEHPYIYQMLVNFIDENTFVYENEYDVDYIERATMVRYSTNTRDAKSSSPVNIKRHPKSLFSNY